jgi:putative ABC transport system permease protein
MREAWLSDLRHAVRTLFGRARGFTSVAVTTLGAGLALTVTVAAVVNAYLVRGLPFPASERLFTVQYAAPGSPPPQRLDTLDWASLDDIVEHPIAWDLDNFVLRGAPHPEAAQGTWVTRGYMEGFGIRPALGRGFEAADFETGRPAVALISHRLWQARFGGDPSVLGRQFDAHVDDRTGESEAFTVIGVLPDRFWHLNAFTEVMSPLRAPWYPYMLRLREGVTPAVAAERITALVRAGAVPVPDEWRAELQSTHAAYVAQVRPLLLSLAAATALVLLIACANVAVLLMVRATRGRREIAVRKALGATTARITRGLVAEAVVIGASATALALVLAQTILSALGPVMDRQLGRAVPGGPGALELDAVMLLVGLAGGVLITCVCSVVPLWALSRTPVSMALTAGQKGAGEGPAQRRARAALIAIEVAACLTLLVGAALMVQSGLRMLDVPIGLDADDVLVGRITLRQGSYPDPSTQHAFYERLEARVAAQPGVAGLAFSSWWPLQAAPPRDVRRDEAGAQATRAGLVRVSPGYFDTLAITLRDGRAFAATDRSPASPLAIVSETLAQRLWPGRRAVGERLVVAPPAGAANAAPVAYTIVGVAADVRHAHTDDDLADVYLALTQWPSLSTFTYVRAQAPPPQVERDLRAAIAAVDADVALGTPRRLDAILDQQRAAPRFLASLLVVFATLAAALAILGIYGVIAYAVRQREREIAVRMAIGADRAAITRLFLRQGGSVLAVGLALGVAGAIGLGRLLESQLFGVRPADPLVIAGMTLAFAVCGLLAVTWPARMAAATDPALALKE